MQLAYPLSSHDFPSNSITGWSKYAETVTPIIKGFGGNPLVRGGKSQTFDGNNFIRTVIWEFPSYEKAIECHNSAEYQAGWKIAKETTVRNMQIVEGFSTE